MKTLVVRYKQSLLYLPFKNSTPTPLRRKRGMNTLLSLTVYLISLSKNRLLTMQTNPQTCPAHSFFISNNRKQKWKKMLFPINPIHSIAFFHISKQVKGREVMFSKMG